MDTNPQTLQEALEILTREMPKENKRILKNTPRDKLDILHLTLGVWIRDNFGLGTGENEKLLYSCAENSDTEYVYPDIGMAFMHPDEASIIIIQALWERLNEHK